MKTITITTLLVSKRLFLFLVDNKIRILKAPCNNSINHKNYNFLDCYWFKKLLFFH